MHLSKGFDEKKGLHISGVDRKFVHNLKVTKEFLRKNKDFMLEYIRDMGELLNNFENFERLDQDPTKKLNSNIFRMSDNWRRRGLLGEDTGWNDVDAINTVLPRCFVLIKIHKENYPLRLVISTINTPTKFLI